MPPSLAKMIGERLRPRRSLWAGPCGSGPQGGVTQSMIGHYLSCKERFRVKHVLGLQPPPRFNKAMEYGNMWHACEEALAGGSVWYDRLCRYCDKLFDRYPMQRDEVGRWREICAMQFAEYVHYWSDHPDVVDRRPLMQEEVFDVKYRLATGRVARLRGKFDSVDLIPSKGGIWLQENKSKSEVDEQDLLRMLRFDVQTMTYQIALSRYDWTQGKGPFDGLFSVFQGLPPICGVRYNVVRRPLSGGKGNIKPHAEKVTKARYGTGRNAGKLLAPSVVTPAETEAEFIERLRRDYIAADPASWFLRIESRVSPEDVGRFEAQCLEPILENMADDFEWWSWCLETGEDHWDHKRRSVVFMNHCPRDYRYPFGVYNAITESGATEYDHYLDSGGDGGLRRAESLFPELQEDC
jgi:hypothetical protein